MDDQNPIGGKIRSTFRDPDPEQVRVYRDGRTWLPETYTPEWAAGFDVRETSLDTCRLLACHPDERIRCTLAHQLLPDQGQRPAEAEAILQSLRRFEAAEMERTGEAWTPLLSVLEHGHGLDARDESLTYSKLSARFRRWIEAASPEDIASALVSPSLGDAALRRRLRVPSAVVRSIVNGARAIDLAGTRALLDTAPSMLPGTAASIAIKASPSPASLRDAVLRLIEEGDLSSVQKGYAATLLAACIREAGELEESAQRRLVGADGGVRPLPAAPTAEVLVAAPNADGLLLEGLYLELYGDVAPPRLSDETYSQFAGHANTALWILREIADSGNERATLALARNPVAAADAEVRKSTLAKDPKMHAVTVLARHVPPADLPQVLRHVAQRSPEHFALLLEEFPDARCPLEPDLLGALLHAPDQETRATIILALPRLSDDSQDPPARSPHRGPR